MNKPVTQEDNPNRQRRFAGVTGSAARVTKDDVRTLREILKAWDAISNVDKLEDGYANATDHCHDIYDAGYALLEKLERMLTQPPNEKLSRCEQTERGNRKD